MDTRLMRPLVSDKDFARFLVGHIQHFPIGIPRLWAEEDFWREIGRHIAYGHEVRMLPGCRSTYRYFRKTAAHIRFHWLYERYCDQYPHLSADMGRFLRYYIFDQKGWG